MAQPPDQFTFSPAVHPLTASPAAFQALYPHVTDFMTGIVVFRTSPTLQALVVRRAANDSHPLHWETPGGGIDATDASILSAAARELWEETGLVAQHFHAPVLVSPMPDFSTPEGQALKKSFSLDPESKESVDTIDMDGLGLSFTEPGRRWGKVAVLADAVDTAAVTIRPDEHDRWAWITEEEATSGKFASGETLGFVAVGVMQTVVEGFRIKKALLAAAAA